jgi:hypothetical protein
MRRDKHTRSRVDNNQLEIIKALRKIPNLIVQLGHDDFLVGYKGKTYWFECKSLSAISKRTGKPLKSSITPSQKLLLANWTGHYKVVWTLDMVLKEIGLK